MITFFRRLRKQLANDNKLQDKDVLRAQVRRLALDGQRLEVVNAAHAPRAPARAKGGEGNGMVSPGGCRGIVPRRQGALSIISAAAPRRANTDARPP